MRQTRKFVLDYSKSINASVFSLILKNRCRHYTELQTYLSFIFIYLSAWMNSRFHGIKFVYLNFLTVSIHKLCVSKRILSTYLRLCQSTDFLLLPTPMPTLTHDRILYNFIYSYNILIYHHSVIVYVIYLLLFIYYITFIIVHCSTQL